MTNSLMLSPSYFDTMIRDIELLRNQYQPTGLYTSTKKASFLKQISQSQLSSEKINGEKAQNFKVTLFNSFKSKKSKICNIIGNKLFLFSVIYTKII